MLVILVKTALIVLLVFFVIRLMGKRQIGEMQPFEFVITLILAEVACLPMNDPSIPLHTGVVPVITLAFLDIMLTFVSRLSYRFRKLADGGSVIVIGPSGFISDNMKKMNMNVDDILVSARTAAIPTCPNWNTPSWSRTASSPSFPSATPPRPLFPCRSSWTARSSKPTPP